MPNNNIAIIPARGGSKRIPNKNIKSFLGKPIIKYAIDAANQCRLFSEIIVSTDDEKIAELSRKLGSNVPFLRSKNTANDYSTVSEVIEEVIFKYKEMGMEFENICCILATSPFITPKKIIEAKNLMDKNDNDSIIPVVKFSYPIQRAYYIKNGRLKMFNPKNLNTRSQDLTPAYHDSGMFYWVRTKSFIREKNIFTSNSFPMILSEFEANDIDTQEDWKIAEKKYKFIHHKL